MNKLITYIKTTNMKNKSINIPFRVLLLSICCILSIYSGFSLNDKNSNKIYNSICDNGYVNLDLNINKQSYTKINRKNKNTSTSR
jgi:hypothetical protein